MRSDRWCLNSGSGGWRAEGAFVLHEALAIIAMIALLIAAVAVGLAESRRQASLGDSLANLRPFAIGTGAYGADNAERIWTFSWREGVQYVPGVPSAASDAQAAANQAVWIIRRRADPTMPLVTGWLPHISYSHLVLADYLDTSLPERWWASPEDRQLLSLQSSAPGGGAGSRPRYGSSYELPPCFWSPDARLLNPTINTIAQGSTHTVYTVPTATPLGFRRLDEIRHPAHKAMMFDRYQRHFGPQVAFFAYDVARVPVLAADGAAALRQSADANPGFRPNSPTSSSPTTFNYAPTGSEPATLSGASQEQVTGRIRWTRSGLRGRDFGGPEVPWVD